jgi:hypothetical protein
MRNVREPWPVDRVAPSAAPERSAPEQEGLIDWIVSDPLLLGVIIISVLIVAYQLVVMVLKPAFLPTATDWLRAGLAWVEWIPLGLASRALFRARRPGAVAWLMLTCAMLSYAIAQSTWAILNEIVEPNNVPVPSQADLFYLLQYPFFFLALALWPGISRRGQPGITRAKVVLDSLLLMAAGTALSWYFILAPFYLQSGQPVLGKATNLAYPVGDLGLLFGLAVVVTRRGVQDAGRLALRILLAAVVFLIIADSLFLYTELYLTLESGQPQDTFWIVCYLLFTLAGLVRWRVAQQEGAVASRAGPASGETGEYPSAHQVVGVFRLLIPFIAALAASALLVTRAAITATRPQDLLIPFSVSFGLVLLVLARQGITVLENEQLLRREQQRAEELALAHGVAEEQRQLLAERNQRLERDIEHLKEVHARVARGDASARARIETGELLPIAGSLNLMLDRLSSLNRVNSEYARLDHALQSVIEAAQGLAMNDDRALKALSAPTNTPLDGVAIALSQLRARLKEMSAGLLQLDLARQASHELAEMMVQQSRFITNEGAALGGTASALNRMAEEIERVAQMLEQQAGPLLPAQRQMAQILAMMQLVVRAARQQIKDMEEQVVRFAQAEHQAQLAAIGTRRLAAELDAAARSGGSRTTFGIPGMPDAASPAGGMSRAPSGSLPGEKSTAG